MALNNIYQSHGMVENKEQIPVGDKGNVGQKVEEKIQQKYKVSADAIEEEDELNEYGEELEFEDSDDSEAS